MLRLMLAPPGVGKTHWLNTLRRPDAVVVQCANMSHKAILRSICEQAGIEHSTHDTINDLLVAIVDARPMVILLDNIDRTSKRFQFSLLAIGQVHDVYCTATERRKVDVLTDRGAAILVPPPRYNIRAILAERFPDLDAHQVQRICATATTPAAAVNMAQAIRQGAGDELPAPPQVSLAPVLIILAMGLIYFVRYESLQNPFIIASIPGVAWYIRRLMWKHV